MRGLSFVSSAAWRAPGLVMASPKRLCAQRVPHGPGFHSYTRGTVQIFPRQSLGRGMPRMMVTDSGSGAAAASGDTVRVHYTGTLDDGSEFDSSRNGEPLTAVLGQGMVIPGFEKALIGMKVGEVSDVHITVDEAYGDRRDDLVVKIDRAKGPEGLQEGMMVQLSNGQPAQVVSLTDDTIEIDVNHPLAGQALNFKLELMEIQ